MVFTDYIVVIVYFGFIVLLASKYTNKAGKSRDNFFLSGRNLPWWIAGTAMVATTFAADTPLAVTELVAKNGIAGNWLWWNMAIGSVLTAFFFAKLWRRTNITTDVEFVELRYSGKPAAVLRGFRALYLGLFMNSIVIAWVNAAMEKIFSVTMPEFDSFLLIVISLIVISIYSSATGLLGSARIDSIQFVIALAGTIILAFFVVNNPDVGGVEGLQSKLPDWIFNFTPELNSQSETGILGGIFAISSGAFFAYIGLQWWASWYPGADPGGGGYIAQRMMSAKDEKHSFFATIWFTIAHYCLRPWPWIIAALAALVLLPRFSANELNYYGGIENIKKGYELFVDKNGNNYDEKYSHIAEKFNDKEFFEKYENTIDPGKMYPKLMVNYLPKGLLGLVMAVFLAAYMSTISSQLNWGTSYIINDFYSRFISKAKSEQHYVLVSRITIVLLIILSLIINKFLLNSISGAWEFIINASAGIGAVLILRWYWWRINAWSEISAFIAPLIIYPIAKYHFNLESPYSLYPTVILTSIVWLTVTFLTKPENEGVLDNFYKTIKPGGIGWKKFQIKFPEIKIDLEIFSNLVNWILGIIIIYSVLFSTGKIIFSEYLSASIGIVIVVIAVVFLNRKISENG